MIAHTALTVEWRDVNEWARQVRFAKECRNIERRNARWKLEKHHYIRGNNEAFILVPKWLHHSIWHCRRTGKNLQLINALVFDWQQRYGKG